MVRQSPPPPLSAQQLDQALVRLPDWSMQQGKLHRVLVFPEFMVAMEFMAAVARVAQAMDHHPEWRNVYRTVEIDLTTHESGGVTERDLALATEIDRIASQVLHGGTGAA